MPILVTTSGPIADIVAVDPFSGTLGTMSSAIADDIDDTTGEYSSQIQKAIQAAIRYSERFPFYFNQTRDITFQTVPGRQFYDATDNPNIPTLIHINAAWTEDETGQRSGLMRAMENDVELMSDNSASRGEPYAFTYFERKIRIYPIPDARIFTIRLQVSPYRLAPVTTDAESNAWFTEAFDLIKARAKYILAKDTLKDAIVAAEALNDFNDQLDALQRETSSRGSRGVIIASCF